MDKHCVGSNYTILETIENFQTNHDRVACVVNENEKIIGIVSQGDIIRAICNGTSLYARIKKIIKPTFLYLTERDMEKAYKSFRENKITMIPVVSNDFYLTDVVTLEDIYDHIEKKMEELK